MRAGSPAEKAGLQRDDVITRIGDMQITDLQAMTDALRAHKPGDVVPITVERDGKPLTVTGHARGPQLMATVLKPEPDRRRAARRLYAGGGSRQGMLHLAAERIQAAGSPYTSVYMYMLHGDELVLEAFAGRDTEHTRIAVGQGVCGTAVATGADQNVPDVRARENYIACNVWTRSELVVLIRRGSMILGQIDVDSDAPDPVHAGRSSRP